MEKFTEIDGFDTSLAELFEAVGFINAESISKPSAEHVYQELSKANEMLNLVEKVPSVDLISKWQSLFDVSVEVDGDLTVSDASPAEEVVEAKAVKPVPRALSISYAVPLAHEFISEHELDLELLPTADLADEAVLELRNQVPGRDQHIFSAEKVVKKAPVSEPKKRELDISRVKTFEEFRVEGGHVAPLERDTEGDLSKAPKVGSNDGLRPESRRFLRGVLHNEPSRTLIGAIAFIISQLLLVLAVIPIIYILMDTKQYMWGLLTPALLVLSGLLYVSMARQASCPVCRQRQFVHKDCRKHVKAHLLPGFGHMLPTALHVIFFKWFRCIFCGTSIRIKE